MNRKSVLKKKIVLISMLIYLIGYIGISYHNYQQPVITYLRGKDMSRYLIVDGDQSEFTNPQVTVKTSSGTTTYVLNSVDERIPIIEKSYRDKGYSFGEYLWMNSNAFKLLRFFNN